MYSVHIGRLPLCAAEKRTVTSQNKGLVFQAKLSRSLLMMDRSLYNIGENPIPGSAGVFDIGGGLVFF